VNRIKVDLDLNANKNEEKILRIDSFEIKVFNGRNRLNEEQKVRRDI